MSDIEFCCITSFFLVHFVMFDQVKEKLELSIQRREDLQKEVLHCLAYFRVNNA